MDKQYEDRLAYLMDRHEQSAFKNQIKELRKDPRKFARTQLFGEDVNQSETWFSGGNDRDGNEINFGYTHGRNVAGFFLTFKVTGSINAGRFMRLEHTNIQPHKKRKNAKRVSAERADEEREKQGLGKIYEHHYKEREDK